MSSNNPRSSSTRSLLALVCLGLLMLLFISLGRWQLSRAQERQSLAQQIEQGRQQAQDLLEADPTAQQIVQTFSAEWLPETLELIPPEPNGQAT